MNHPITEPESASEPKAHNRSKTDAKPRIYDRCVEVFFSHLDTYGHVNSKHYLDFVSTSRMYVFAEKFGLTMAALKEKNCAFYMVESAQRFLRPISGLQPVRVISHVSNNTNKIVTVSYKLTDDKETTIYSTGEAKYVVIDIKLNKKISMPTWMKECFYEE